ncbi:benzoyl-CoA reductase, bis-(molybdopterin)-oxotungsten-binding subunit, putative [Geotalea daltonii FRC-32]|uniref:Benzoyl-CoA reductase, bis-(Molybdopterin)-oxotungsten-binding subunit, putative n=1 Tax=Geotalea daltonii (strain DSM 22248 / JCM 15807 / FRC-32) TaxID=316067 RepID=B9M941_GEODF|nr:aldehyde ferredoxin oxidoreductase N-terminal domain-containing protein [Geotalea daltonii]ACM18599.1 benzoyl-CoA reductase, bis-(molybdopterin)-oxotungsten-binding subunit, putative [Geotalea daltonii FRC-32]
MKYAETGFALEVDLTRGNIEKVPTDPKMTGLHLGGDGVAAAILWERVPPEVAPQSPANLLIFSAGLLAGTPIPGANRTCVSSISLQSNLLVNANFEGFFAPELKHAGYDRVVIRGKSTSLVYLWIHDDKVEICDASHLQGKSAMETTAILRKELKDPNVQVATIGVAGENKVSQASIEHANSSASQGLGVIMGDKGLKAIAVRGTKDLGIARPDELFARCNALYGEIYDNPSCGDLLLSEHDNAWHVANLPWTAAGERVKGFWTPELGQEWGVRVEREEIGYQWENYSQEMEEVRETVVEESKLVRGTGCYNCPKNCHKVLSLPGERQYFLKSYSRHVYAMAAYGDLKLNYDVLYAMQDFGLDENAMVQLFAFVQDLHQAGIFTDSDLPDFPADPIGRYLYILEKVANRQGIGAILAEGLCQAAGQIGKGAEAYVRGVKKTAQLPLRWKTANYASFLMYAAGDKMDISQVEGSFPQLPIPDRKEREAFVKVWDAAPQRFKEWFLDWEPEQQFSIEAAAEIVGWNEAMHYADDILGICPLLSSFRGQFGGKPPYHLNNLPQLVSLATGIELDVAGLLEISRRNRQLIRALNAGRGQRRADDEFPAELWENRDTAMEQQHLDAYYSFMGWTAEGIPTRETLTGAGLDHVSKVLMARGLLTGE